jgi:hypothetical protein
MEGNTTADLLFAGMWSRVVLVNDPKEVQVAAPVLVPLSALYVRLLAATALATYSCVDCLMLPAGKYCLSHVCLDCGRMAHPHSMPCRRTACFTHPGCSGC